MNPRDSVHNEPFFQSRPAPSETADADAVWNEPCRTGGSAHPDSYAGRFYRRFAQTSLARSCLILGAALFATGPFAILCAFVGTLSARASAPTQLLGAVILAPLTEEIGKVALPLMLAETRPWLIRKSGLLLGCAVCSGLIFATFENLLYLHVYLDSPSAALIRWRWLVCTALHVSASAFAGLGLVRMHRHVVETGSPPEYTRAMPWLLAAMTLHGIYNFLVFGASAFWPDFLAT